MKTRVDLRLVNEARDFALAFACEACTAFDVERLTCAYGYPTAPHRQVRLEPDTDVLFCKTFELA